jgi:hypothetical protein
MQVLRGARVVLLNSQVAKLAGLLLVACIGAAGQSFVSAANLTFTVDQYATGIGPYGVATGDFNGDGKADLAVANFEDGTVSVLLGNGDGTFQPHVDYKTDVGTTNVSVGDVNADGHLDIITSNSNSTSTVSVLLGNGDGTFQPAVNYTAGTYTYAPTLGDFNGDGKIDIIVTNFGDLTFSVFLGNGDGTFQPAKTFAVNHRTGSLVAGDFNRDGKLDLAGPDNDDNEITVYIGNGDGTFQPGVDYAGGSQPSGIKTGDFNHDGKLDLAASNACADNDPGCFKDSLGTASIFLGKGDGTFEPKHDYPAGYDALDIALDDFNGDGNLDVAVVNGCNFCSQYGYVTVQLGNGDGTLQPAISINNISLLPVALTTGHFDGSSRGSADIAVADLANYDGTTVSVLLNNAATRFAGSSSPNPSQQGQTVTLTARVLPAVKGAGSPAGTVTFYNGKTKLGTASLAKGVAQFMLSNLPTGKNPIRGLYSGDTQFNRSLSPPHIQVVNP